MTGGELAKGAGIAAGWVSWMGGVGAFAVRIDWRSGLDL